MELHFKNNSTVEPPGSLTQLLNHPTYSHRSVEVSVFNEHRYAFYFWNKWTQYYVVERDYINFPPDLVTLDWHQDLAPPNDDEKKWLEDLNLQNNRDVALYTWANLSQYNDTHILAAAYLGIIGDIYVHCRQDARNEWKDYEFVDRYGRVHTVKRFKEFDALESHLVNSDIVNVYFDIDLDFFTVGNPLAWGQGGTKYTYLPDNAIKEILRPDRPLISWIFERLWGLTIALEPEHTGGLAKSQKYLGMLDKLYFSPSLFTTIPGVPSKSTQWRHHRKSRI